MDFSRKIAEYLLESEAVKISIDKPFTWASGWKSPIYCDNRQTLAYPIIRKYIKEALVQTIKDNFDSFDVIAGVATGAIAQGALVADTLEKPFCYIRSAPKEHGLSKLIEGKLVEKQKVVIIEDLISTGGSSLKAVEAVKNENAFVEGMIAIFTYGFQKSIDSFKKANVNVVTLCNYDILIQTAIEKGYVNPEHLQLLQNWRKDPENWGK